MSDRLAEAGAWAERLHRGQVRKGTTIPYIAHLYGVAALVLEWGGDEDAAIAALLHDAVEDCGGEPVAREIGDRFGEPVALIVLACSDSIGSDSSAKADWGERKRDHIARVSTLTPAAALVTAADKLHNLRALIRDVRRDGPETLQRFKEPARIIWYYGEMYEAINGLVPTEVACELQADVAELTSLLQLPSYST